MKKENYAPENNEEIYEGILGDYQEEPEAPASDGDAQTEEAAPKKSSKNVLAAVGIAASVALLGCLTTVGIGLYNKTAGSVVTQTPNYTVDNKILACYYRESIEMFVSYYGEETLASSYGLDVNKSLKEQAYPYDQTQTWYDVIMDQAKATMTQHLVICEAAKADGYVLPEEDANAIEETIALRDLNNYGNGVTENDLRTMLEMQAYSNAYYTYYMDSLLTDEKIEAYYEANKLAYQTCGLAGFSISFDTGETNAEGEPAADLMTKGEAKKLAQDIADSKNAKEFEDKVAAVLTDYEGYSEDDLVSILPSIFNDAVPYSQGNEMSEWAFGGAAVNETFLYEGQTAYYIYMMTAEPGRDETATIDVRHILFMDQEDNEKAAQDALEEWKSGEATEDSFAELAERYSEDPGSAQAGGLYEGVTPGEMVAPFNDWCFDSSRQPGDTGIVETSYGFHVMYFVKQGDPKWKVSVLQYLEQEEYSSWYAGLLEAYPVEIDENAVNKLVF